MQKTPEQISDQVRAPFMRVTLNLTPQDLENVNEIAKLPTIRNRTHAVSTAFAFTRFVVDALRKPDTELMLRENGNITRIVMPELQLGRNRPPEAPSRPQPPMEEERDMA